MLVRDLMTRDVASVGPHAHVGEIARQLLSRGVSAVPVVDAHGMPLGVVSEGDVLCTSPLCDAARLDERRQWWLAQLAEGHALDPGFLASVQADRRTARDLMTSPAICVSEQAEAREAAQLMQRHHVKRLPVVDGDGRMVGIVARADLVRALAEQQAGPPGEWPLRNVAGAGPRRPDASSHPAPHMPPPVTAPTASPAELSAAGFRALVDAYRGSIDRRRAEEQRSAQELRRRQIDELRGKRLTEGDWRDMLDRARQAAVSGAREFLLIRFPAALCRDGGRAINAPDAGWPATLVGEPADIYARWRDELRPRGFRLAAQIVDFPDGLPGDAALILVWRG